MTEAVRRVHAAAPIRICDIGGWTDTWFAGHGRVCNIAVRPAVEVQLTVRPRGVADPPVVLHAEDFGDRYVVVPGEPLPARHPLLEAAVDEVGVPADATVEITIHSDAPAGCSTGTSASVAVALVGALDALGGRRRSRAEIAQLAHRLEVDRLGLQSGVQDQLAAAFGGVNVVEIDDYPSARAVPVPVDDATRWELERRLVLVFLGRAHVSSDVHDLVIAEIAGEGPDAPRLVTLRSLAEQARAAIAEGDLEALGLVMRRNTDAQAALHPALVGAEAEAVIAVARAFGASGWKVNGAGGDGGSLTLLLGADAAAGRALVRALRETNPLFQVIPTVLDRSGLRVWQGPGPDPAR